MKGINLKNVEKGDTYSNGYDGFFIAAINATNESGTWYNQIECHGETKEEAETLRDTLLVFLRKDVMKEVENQIKAALEEERQKGNTL